MSVKELVLPFENKDYGNITIKINDKKELQFLENGSEILALFRDEAHLLMLYLQEHLKNDLINKKLWYCNKCRVYHSKDHVCVRI